MSLIVSASRSSPKSEGRASREDILSRHSIEEYLADKGHQPIKRGEDELVYLCPVHSESTGSFHVTISKRIFHCFGCGYSGSIIDLVSRMEGLGVGGALKKLSNKIETKHENKTMQVQGSPINEKADEKVLPRSSPKIVDTYSYKDEMGKEIFQVVRLEPKSFRQCKMVGKDRVWNMEGIRRILYNLPRVLKANRVILVEGEKDVHSLEALGFVATTSPGGAASWLDGYAESLKGKEVVLCGDNDEAGQKYMDQVFKSLAGKVKSVRKIIVPDGIKDVSDFLKMFPDMGGDTIAQLIEEAQEFHAGVDLPIFSFDELKGKYREYLKTSEGRSLDLGCWLPSFRKYARALVPGEVCTILAETGVGKTAALSNLAHSINLPTLFFEMELPESLMYERFIGMDSKMNGSTVEKTFKQGGDITAKNLSHIFVCPLSKLDPELIEELIVKAELRMGQKPAVVMIDYMGLIADKGSSRYEKMSMIAEKIKIIAKNTNTIIVCASQVRRKGDKEATDVHLNDGKDSGSIENSSGLVLGMWRDTNDAEKMFVRILKNTKGKSGATIPCWFYGETLTISEATLRVSQ